MEECGRGAAVEQLTARGMEYQSPKWGAIGSFNFIVGMRGVSIPAMGAIGDKNETRRADAVSIPEMGGNSRLQPTVHGRRHINPRNGGQ